MTNWAPRSAASLLAGTLLIAACGYSGLAFRQDERVTIVEPDDRSRVTLPLTVSWEVRDFAFGPGEGAFGVLLDEAPPRPGETLDSISGHLTGRAAFTTMDTFLRIERVAPLGPDDGSFHEITVVLLDESGRRVGEGAWTVEFRTQDER